MVARGRKRPGQRATSSRAADSRVYDVELNRQIRARAKFEAISLGQAARKYGSSCKLCVPVVRTYIAKDVHPTIINDELSNEELKIIFNLKDYSEGRSTSLKLASPLLHRKIEQMLVSIAEERLAKARRARHTPHVLAYSKFLESLPRYKPLILTGELAESIPY
jgi:hypothetical protein